MSDKYSNDKILNTMIKYLNVHFSSHNWHIREGRTHFGNIIACDFVGEDVINNHDPKIIYGEVSQTKNGAYENLICSFLNVFKNKFSSKYEFIMKMELMGWV